MHQAALVNGSLPIWIAFGDWASVQDFCLNSIFNSVAQNPINFYTFQFLLFPKQFIPECSVEKEEYITEFLLL